MTDSVSLKIEGMSCQHCVRAVRAALESLDGVEVESVDVGSAELTFDPSKASIAQITDIVADAGYPAEPRLTS